MSDVSGKISTYVLLSDNICAVIKDAGDQICLQSLYRGLEKPSLVLNSIRRTKGKRIAGTCEWILTNPKYTEWAATEGSQLLCVVGGPGIGKTMIASYLVNQIETRVKCSLLQLCCYISFVITKTKHKENPKQSFEAY